MDDVLSFLLRERVVVADDANTADYWARTAPLRARFSSPIDQALAGGRAADRFGFAFAAGYEAAVHALVPALAAGAVAGFSVSEERGNHPRAIETKLERAGAGYELSGKKRWSTMGPLSDVLVVIAKAGIDADGRPALRAALVDRGASGVSLTEMAPTPFVPEVPHAELVFDRVAIAESAVLPGDGYADYTKPFRTVEDVHVNAGLLGYLVSVARRYGWSDPLVEDLSVAVLAARCLAALDPRKAETHVALAGFLRQMEAVMSAADPSWSLAGDAERDRWYRDRVLTQVASKPRQQRRERAHASLHGDLPR